MRLEIVSTGSSPEVSITSADTGTSQINFGGTTTPKKGVFRYSDNSDLFIWLLNSSAEQMRLTSTGLGIGTSSPAKLLDVNGDALIYGLTVGRGSGNVATNTAFGYQAGLGITTSIGATLIGYQAGSTYTSGKSYNTMIGYQAGSLSTSAQSTFIGYLAGKNCTGTSNTFVGPQNDSSGSGSGELITSGNYNTILGAFSGNSNGLDIRTASNYVVLSDGVGNPLISTANSQTVALKGAIPNSGTGITFPATQSASSDANTLDDYEEGTWTPVVSDATTGGNLATLASGGTDGVYTKIGNIVYWRFTVELYKQS